MKNYDFEVLVDEINNNKQLALQKEREEKETRNKNKITILRYISIATLILIIIIGLIIATQFKHKTIITTPYGNYVCKGKIVRICSGNEKTKEYLGK